MRIYNVATSISFRDAEVCEQRVAKIFNEPLFCSLQQRLE